MKLYSTVRPSCGDQQRRNRPLMGRHDAGFACAGECNGGNWHGKGGFVEVDEVSTWAQLLLLFAIASMICIAVYIVGTYVGRFWARCKGYSPLASDSLEVGGSMAKYADQRQIGTHLVV